MRGLIYHGAFVLVLSFLLMNVVYAQELQAGAAFSTPRLIVFGLAVVVSIITDGLVMGFLAGGFHPMRAIVSSIPFSFLNVFWWDFVAPAVATYPFLVMKFMQVGDPALGYWVGSNVLVVFLGNLIWEQVIFRFARGAAASDWGVDIGLAALDAALPAIFFIVLPMFGVF